MGRAVFLDIDSIDCGDLSRRPLTDSWPDWQFHPHTRPEQTAGRIAGAQVILSNKVLLDRALLESVADSLQLVCVAATGTNNVDLDAAAELGIPVTNVTGYATPSVVQHVFATLLALTTRLEANARAAIDGSWAASDMFCVLDYPFRELAGKTLGIVGFGELGRGVARVAEAFGMRVLVAQRPGGEPQPERLPLDELLPRVDVLSLHVPLADNTRNLIGADELALMRDDALLINTARGGIVDEAALADALCSGRLGGAALDVLATEPPAADYSLLSGAIPNLLITPHIAWASRESRQRLLDQLADILSGFNNGAIKNRVA